MNRLAFNQQLSDGLKKLGITDIDEILKDYESHFDNELLKGRTEEEVSKALGKIDDILLDFKPENKAEKQRKFMNAYSVIISDIFIYMGMLSLYLVNLAIISLSLASLLMGIYAIIQIHILEFIPTMMFPFSLFFGLTFMALAILSYGLSAMLFKYLNILMKRLGLWHKQILKGQYLHQFISVKQSKMIKVLTLWSGIAVILFMIVTYIVGVNLTHSPEFWHEWHWFS